MDKIKSKFEILAIFAAIFISLSAFKDELTKCKVDIGFVNLPLSSYFLILVVGISISMYCFILESTVRDMAIGRWKIFNGVIWLAYFIFVISLCTPILLFLSWSIYQLYKIFPSNKTWPWLDHSLNLIPSILSVMAAFFTTRSIVIERRAALIIDIVQLEIGHLENAIKLYNDQYYSQSVLETFKALEAHLFQKLINKGVRVSQQRTNDIIRLSLENNIITSEDKGKIEDIRGMRNAAAHADITYTKNEAEFALNFVRELLSREGRPTRKRD